MDFSTITQYDLWWIPLLSGPHTVFFDIFTQVLTSGWTWIALYLTLLFVVIKNNETMLQIGLVVLSALICVLLADGLADGIAKPATMRLRPLNDPNVRPLLDIVAGVANKNYSFFSAHAANTMSLCVFFSLLFRSVWTSVVLACWSLINCWTRIYLSMHYPSDILVGLLWGITVGILVYIGYLYAYRRVSPRLHFISSQYTRTGYAFSDMNLVINVVLLTIVYAILRTLMMI